MNDEGWKGAESLNTAELSSAFWDQVAGQGDRKDAEDLQVGDLVFIETPRETYRIAQYGIVTKTYIGDDNLPKIEFRQALPHEFANRTPVVTFLMGNDQPKDDS